MGDVSRAVRNRVIEDIVELFGNFTQPLSLSFFRVVDRKPSSLFVEVKDGAETLAVAGSLPFGFLYGGSHNVLDRVADFPDF